MARKKALIIGINYYNSTHQLNGCINDANNVREFLVNNCGFSPEAHDMVVLTDDPGNYGTPFWPSGQNMMAAFQWLASCNRPGDVLWLSYSGHGGQTRDPEGDRASGFDDTICPVDFEQRGQITSDTLHEAIVTPMNPQCRLTVLLDCCHSGSALELPYVFRPDADGNINLVDTLKQGMGLVRAAEQLMEGPFTMDKVAGAKMLLGGATDFWQGLHHQRNLETRDSEGLETENFAEHWEREGKDVWMFSGCADNQTSADTRIAGAATGAMSYAFIGTMREMPDQTYVNVLQNTRHHLLHHFSQIPQLSCGGHYNLDQRVVVS